jgi:hypothetical protein
MSGDLKVEKPFGYDVEVICGWPPVVKQFHWRGTEATVRRKAKFCSHYAGVESLRPLTREQWIGGYGLGRM